MMTIEQALAEIANIEPEMDSAWKQLQEKEAENKNLEQRWQELYTRLHDLRAFIKVMGGEPK